MKTNFIECVKNTILQNNLINYGDSVLIAISGGADSVCLMSVLHELKEEFSLNLYAAHVNHMLRGDESDHDEEFVRNISAYYNIPIYCLHVDVNNLAKKNKISCEEAGRKARYDFFLKLKSELEIDKIATAHNKNDNIETVCMRFLRGTGIDGLSGIPITNDLCVVRPLLHVTRNEIENHLNSIGIKYVTDSSNLTDNYTRNRIRHHFLPYVEQEYNENFVDTLSENILIYKEAGTFLKNYTNDVFNKLSKRENYGFCFDLTTLLQLDAYIAKSLIKLTIHRLTNFDVSSKIVRLIYQNIIVGSSRCFEVNANLTIHRDYDKIYFVLKKTKSNFYYEHNNERKISICETGDTFEFSEENCDGSYKDKNVLFINKSLCEGKKIVIRNRRPGDAIYLNCGHKSVKKLLIDEKIPSFLRDEIPIMLLDNEIIWVCGIRNNSSFRTKNNECLKITYSKEKKHE